MTKKTILFIGLIICFLGVLAYVETLERERQEQAELLEQTELEQTELEQTELKQTEISEFSSQGEQKQITEEDKKGPLDELSIEKENCLIPLTSLEGWEVSGPFNNPENCEENKLFSNMRPAYCAFDNLKDSYSVFWKKDIQTKGKSVMSGTIVASAFEFSDESSIALEDIVSAHSVPLKFLENFEIDGITIQRQEFKYGIRLISKEEAEGLTEQELTEQTIMLVSYSDIFSLDNVVFTVSYDEDYIDEAKIIEKAIISLSNFQTKG